MTAPGSLRRHAIFRNTKGTRMIEVTTCLLLIAGMIYAAIKYERKREND